MKVISGSFTITAVEDGEDAVSMVISPQNIVAKKNVGYQTYSFDVSVVKGGTKIKQGEWTVDYKVNGVYSGSYIIDGVLYFDNVTLKDDYTLRYDFILHPESVADTNLTFAVNYEGVTYPQSVRFQTLAEPEIYEIVLANAYCIYNPNEESDNVNGLIEGHLYKVVGDRREAMSGVSIEYGYSETIGQELDGSPLYDTTDTDDDGFFTSGGWFGDTYGNEYVGNSKSIIARYKKDGNVVVQVNVGISQNGMKGERGAPLRISYWAEGWTYYTGKNANDPYTDVVIVEGNYYLCMSNHIATSSNKPVDGSTNKTFWEKSSKIDMVATEVLLADNAHIDLLSSNRINVNNSSGKETAGLSGGDGVQLWGGGERETANFRVYDNGDVFVEGTVKAKNLFRSLCVVWDDGNMILDNKPNSIYYVKSTDGLKEYDDIEGTNYHSLFTIGTYVDWDKLNNGDSDIAGMFGDPSSFGTDFVKTTANADMIILLDRMSANWNDNSEAKVILPHPNHYKGKTIQVDHSKTKGSIPAIIGCVESYKFAGNFSYSNNGFAYTSTPSTITINAGQVAQFYSTGDVWLYL